MRIVISGTHASGKSTLIADFAARHPAFVVLPDPFELLDETWDAPGAGMFAAQLRIAAERLGEGDPPADLIAERGPLDFVAYLLALDEVQGTSTPRDLLARYTSITARAMRAVDLLVVLPLSARDEIDVGADEHLALRTAMNDVLLELIDDPELVGDGVTVAEVTGDRDERLATLEALLDDQLHG